MPLTWATGLSDEEQRSRAQEILKKAVYTYHRDWRLFQEPLQNAIDSFIDQNTGLPIQFEEGHVPKVKVIFDVDEDLVTIEDNGSGIKRDDHRYMIDPYSGGKDVKNYGAEGDDDQEKRKRTNLKGNQGIGAKTVVFGSSKFEIYTKHHQEDIGWSWEGEKLYTVPKDGEPEELNDLEEWIDENIPHGTMVTVRAAVELDGFTTEQFIEEKIRTWSKDLGLELRQEQNTYSKKLDLDLQLSKIERKIKSKLAKINKQWRGFKREYGDDFGLNRKSKPKDIEENKAARKLWKEMIVSEIEEKITLEGARDALEKESEQLKKKLDKIYESLINLPKEHEKKEHIVRQLETYAEAVKNLEEAKKLGNEEEIEEVKSIYSGAVFDLFENETRSDEYKFYQKKSKKDGFSADLGRVLRHYLLFKTYAGDITRVVDADTALPDVEIELKIKCTQNFDGIKPIEGGELIEELVVGYQTVQSAWDRLSVDHSSDKMRQNATALITKNKIVEDDWKEIVTKNNDDYRDQFFTHTFVGDELEELLGYFRLETDKDGEKVMKYYAPDPSKLKKSKTGFGSALTRINGIHISISNSKNLKGKLGVPPGQWISVNGLPTDIKAEIEGVGDGGFRTSMHIIVDVDGTLGIGKRNLGGEGPGLHGTLKNTVENFLVGIWTNLVRIARRITVNEEKETDGKLIDFNEGQLAEIEDENSYDVMLENFGRTTLPTTEDDIIQMHNYWLGKNNFQFGWQSLSGVTEIDGRSEMTHHDGVIKIEYKGPDQVGSNQSGIRNLVYKNNLKGGRQSFAKYDVAVVWEPPTSSKINAVDNTCEWFPYASDPSQHVYPTSSEMFPRECMFRIEKDAQYICVFSLQILYQNLVKESSDSE